jgi:CoA:oxalate CoA-transferase
MKTGQVPDETNALPLKGVRVLDLGMNIAGPQAASLLADLGAEVIKVEPPQGDTSRALEPKISGVSAMVVAMNRNKRFLGLDLRRPRSAPVRDALLRWADVAVQNLRPGKADELGIGADQAHAVNPRLVHLSIEAFYPSEGSRPGYDLLVQAETGMMHLTGEPDRPPSRLPGSLLDHTTGLFAAFGVTAALHGPRDRHKLVVSMSDVAQNLLGDRVAAYLFDGEAPRRMGSAISVTTPLQAYRTGDGDLAVGAASDALFRRLGDALGVALADDPRYSNQASRLTHRHELDKAIEEALASADADTWFERLSAAGVPAARVRDLSGAVARHRELSRTGLLSVEGLPGAELVANPLGASVAPARPGPVGADSRSLLVDVLGFAPEEYQRLVDDGVVVASGGEVPA